MRSLPRPYSSPRTKTSTASVSRTLYVQKLTYICLLADCIDCFAQVHTVIVTPLSIQRSIYLVVDQGHNIPLRSSICHRIPPPFVPEPYSTALPCMCLRAFRIHQSLIDPLHTVGPCPGQVLFIRCYYLKCFVFPFSLCGLGTHANLATWFRVVHGFGTEGDDNHKPGVCE